MLRGMSLVAVLLVASSAVFANEIVTNGNLENAPGYYYGAPMSAAFAWDGIAFMYDGEGHGLYAQGGYGAGTEAQIAQQFLPLDPTVFANSHLTINADLKAWTTGIAGDWAKIAVRLAFYDSSLGAGWQFIDAPGASFTNDAATFDWHHVTAYLDLPANFNIGTEWAPCVTLTAYTNDNWQAAYSFDNVSIDSVPAPEPATMALLGVGGVLALIRRRRAA